MNNEVRIEDIATLEHMKTEMAKIKVENKKYIDAILKITNALTNQKILVTIDIDSKDPTKSVRLYHPVTKNAIGNATKIVADLRGNSLFSMNVLSMEVDIDLNKLLRS